MISNESFALLDYETDFGTRCHGVPGDVSGPLSGKNLSEVVNNIVWVQQLELKVTDSVAVFALFIIECKIWYLTFLWGIPHRKIVGFRRVIYQGSLSVVLLAKLNFISRPRM